MKRASLISVVLTVALAIACTTPTNNANKNSSAYIIPGTADPDMVTIAVVVAQETQQSDPVVEVTYPSYAAKQAQKLRWCVYNDTKSTLAQVSIVFPSGGSPCVTDPPPLTNIPAGNDPAICTVTCECGPTAKSYPYTVDVMIGGGHVVNANPRVILN